MPLGHVIDLWPSVEMMKALVLSVLLGILIVPSYAQNPSLKLLNNKERIEYQRTHQFPGNKTIYRDSTGAVLKGFNVRYPVVKGEVLSGLDYYVNAAGKIIEIVARHPAQSDLDLNKKLYDIDEEEMRGSTQPVKINCAQQRVVLTAIEATEKENRKDDKVIDMEIDNVQEATVISLLRDCGTPTVTSVGPEAIRTIVNVLKHARRINQEKYFTVLNSFVTAGALQKWATALVIDRLLMTSGARQRYGTQIVLLAKTGYEVFPVEDPEHLDERRTALGLPKMEEYIVERELFYGAEIKR